jgi:pyruvate dehydrogenase E2 component (dihydrolipoamide acetyltransferase)|tara:strand:- start:3037 stop:4272 length:1236 start_codon:yes stop_codon:yes gene_type:complete
LIVKEGDVVKVDDPIITIETDKAAMDVPSPYPGKVISIYANKGDKVNQGDDLCLIDVDLSLVDDQDGKPEAIITEVSEEIEKLENTLPTEKTSKEHKTSNFISKSFSGLHASPSVRKLARELGVDLTEIKGTGLKERIQPEDLKSYVKGIIAGKKTLGIMGLPELPIIDHAHFGPIETVQLSRIKKISGPRLQASWINIPHVTQHDEVDINELEKIRIDLKDEAKAQGFSLTILAFIIKGVCKVLLDFPDFNSSLDADGENLIHKKYINIGFAANTDKGLMVPVIKKAEQKDLFTIAKELSELSKLARDGKIQLSDMQGGTFTVSSLGGFGGTGFTPIINAPEVAILGVARSQVKPIFIKGQFLPRLTLPISLSYDHRVIDGVGGIQFTTQLKNTLEDPPSFLDIISDEND